MHNRIYQISTIPINPEKYISEINFLEHWFTESITECVNGGLDRNTEIKSFLDLLVSDSISVSNSDDSFTFLPGGKELYFKEAYKRFINAARKTVTITIEDFAGVSICSSLAEQLDSSFCNKYGDYVYSDEFDLVPLDAFVRLAKPGTRYFIGAVLDYHM